MSASRLWTPAQMDELRQHWAAGKSATMIGKAMGRSRNSIIGKVHRMRLPGRKTLERAPLVNGWHWRQKALQGPRKPAGGPKPKRAPRDRKSIKGVSQPPWRAPMIDETAAYEAERRANGAMSFMAMPYDRMPFLCHWPLTGEEGAHGIWCCEPIPRGATYCGHHWALGRTPLRRKLEAAE